MDQTDKDETIKLTSYSRGAGCGCKISPSILKEILTSSNTTEINPSLLVGYGTNDDAAILDIGNNKAIISTTDFFMPIVDDAFDFGQIASANAISDVYAMGGKPIMAIAILGWPVEKIHPSIAQKVLEGARHICTRANIPMAGGHSIDTIEPMFGLAVTGIIDKSNIKKNNTAQAGDFLFITKPIGGGILSTAQKRGVLGLEHAKNMLLHMTSLNSVGELLGSLPEVNALTDVTGFGLLGHCIEMAEGSNVSIELHYSNIPVMEGAKEYLSKRIVPDATYRNWNSYSDKTTFDKGVHVMEAFNLLPDPQTNGGLLFSVRPSAETKIKSMLIENKLEDYVQPIGRVVEKSEKTIFVKI